MARLYNMDIVECEDGLYESLDALVEYAKANPKEFVVYSDVEVVSVDTETGELRIVYKMIDEYDENDNEVWVTKTETFEYNLKDMMTLVA
jgi:hypothetical protein